MKKMLSKLLKRKEPAKGINSISTAGRPSRSSIIRIKESKKSNSVFLPSSIAQELLDSFMSLSEEEFKDLPKSTIDHSVILFSFGVNLAAKISKISKVHKESLRLEIDKIFHYAFKNSLNNLPDQENCYWNNFKEIDSKFTTSRNWEEIGKSIFKLFKDSCNANNVVSGISIHGLFTNIWKASFLKTSDLLAH